MDGIVVNEACTRELHKVCSALTASLSETLGSLIGCALVVQAGSIELITRQGLLGSLQRNCAIVRGALDKNFAGRTLATLFEIQDAGTMAGLLMMAQAEQLEERRARDHLEAADTEAFGELGNVLCSGFSNVLREHVPDIDLRLQDHGMLGPGADPQNMLPEAPLVAFSFRMKIGDHAESGGRIVVDRHTAEAWNKGSLTGGPPEQAAAPHAAAHTAAKPAEPAAARDDDSVDDIPATPVRGILNAYLGGPECFRVLRRSCRRVGLELRRHGRAEIPNPAAHRNEFVVIDVPLGEEKRLDWCRRIKEFSKATRVVVLLHAPSRARVTLAFMSQADAILGLPVEEALLSAKLSALLGS